MHKGTLALVHLYLSRFYELPFKLCFSTSLSSPQNSLVLFGIHIHRFLSHLKGQRHSGMRHSYKRSISLMVKISHGYFSLLSKYHHCFKQGNRPNKMKQIYHYDRNISLLDYVLTTFLIRLICEKCKLVIMSL